MTTIRKSALCVPVLFVLWACAPAVAETLLLKTGEIVEGTIQSYQDNAFSIAQPNGQIRKIPKSEVTHIEIQKTSEPPAEKKEIPKTFLSALPKSASKFQTPLQTFQTWRIAAIAGDVDGMVDCYASFRKNVVKKELKKLSRDQRDQMRKTTATTEFMPGEPLYQGDRAVLEVTWRIGLQSDNQVFQFTLEGNDWKIIQ